MRTTSEWCTSASATIVPTITPFSILDPSPATYGEDSSLAIGMEMFQVPVPRAARSNGATGQIDETVLRRETEYDKRWGFDFSMYRPMLEYARSRGLEVVALNTPRKKSRYAVAKERSGRFASRRAWLRDIAGAGPRTNPQHRALFDAEFDARRARCRETRIERYYEAQVVWDETMGCAGGRDPRPSPRTRPG